MDSEENLLEKWIAVLHRCRKRYVNRQLADYGLSGGHFILLLALSHCDGISQELMAARLTLDKTVITRSVHALETEGYLVRRRSHTDRRVYQLHLTPKGEALLPLIRQTVRKWESETTAGLTEEERAAVERALRKMADNAEKLSRQE